LTTLLTGTLQKEYVKEKGQVELRLTRQWVTMNMPAEPLTLRVIDMPANGLTTLCVLRSEIRCGDELIGTWSIPIEAHLWRDVWVAQSPMKRGDRLLTSDLSKERRDILQLKDVCLSQSLDDDSLELTENLNVGSALLNRSVRAHPVIQRGRMVDAVVTEGVMMITVKALALEDGATGQTIRMKNPKSGGEFRGKVQNEQTVQVTL
jgi:flagella basal body P-ring formation protein FlgA